MLTCLGKFIKAIKPWHIGTAYIVSIFFFGGIFWLMPDGFYHQVAPRDQAIKEQADEVSALLLDHFKESFRNTHGGYEYTSPSGWRIDTSLAQAKSLTSASGKVFFQIDMHFINESKTPIELLTWGPIISWPIENTGEAGTTLDNRDYVGHATISGAMYSPIPMNVLFPGTSPPQSSNIIFVPPSNTLKKMIEYHHASNGLIKHMRRDYLRMLYLSSVTITTLGYGDIVPTTDLARTLVGFEAVFGVLLAGLFLNAVANKPKEGIERTRT